MTYRGQVKNGVVVFKGKLSLKEGTVVRIEPIKTIAKPKRSPRQAPRGSPERILSSKAHWHGDPAEMDRLLEELREMKWAEVRAQQAQGE
jgi:hypothetical protein